MSDDRVAGAERTGPVVLAVLDGWGVSNQTRGNAIALAKTPVMDELYQHFPHTQLTASGPAVGLPEGQPGNSEAGHLNIGAGRIVIQDAVKISREINTGAFFKNAAFTKAIDHVRRRRSALHLMGLLSNEASAHACPDHLFALLTLARRHHIKRVYLHLFTDGRDSPPHAGLKLMNALMRALKHELIATVMGRFYAMDRKKDWTRTLLAYDAMVTGSGLSATSPQAAITESYNRNESDEFIPPYVVRRRGKPVATINDGDGVIFFNLRSDRARQMSKPFVQHEFEKMNPGAFRRRKVLRDLNFVAMTDFGPDLDHVSTAYTSEDVSDSLPRVLRGCKQLYIAEAEKYAHVTFFINGGFADPIGGEDRVRIDSLDVPSYATVPEMSAGEVTDQVVWAVPRYDFICVNYGNADMVGHTGNLPAAQKAVEYIDRCLGRVWRAVSKRNGWLIITADHGNAEMMQNPATGEVDTEHNLSPVPFILAGPHHYRLRTGRPPLASVAPTICQLLAVASPAAMTGRSLIVGRASSMDAHRS
ncbi:MAG: 2,3-bisphosphoglycerate-independent phosphoglycerate mutase [Parcubacteria group bacterium Gr01-1014_31]|nr:MAG: 2,3-bisphosphoglycerate-independent phosphoglycerate mutase [Parcubacteria group bacterium Gr01-1014_31]